LRVLLQKNYRFMDGSGLAARLKAERKRRKNIQKQLGRRGWEVLRLKEQLAALKADQAARAAAAAVLGGEAAAAMGAAACGKLVERTRTFAAARAKLQAAGKPDVPLKLAQLILSEKLPIEHVAFAWHRALP
jgi:hypothetical protein